MASFIHLNDQFGVAHCLPVVISNVDLFDDCYICDQLSDYVWPVYNELPKFIFRYSVSLFHPHLLPALYLNVIFMILLRLSFFNSNPNLSVTYA